MAELIPYGRQWVESEDGDAVLEVLRSDWLTTGPKVGDFERAFASRTGSAEAVAVSSGTAALHAAMAAIGVSEGDEVIVPAMTFVASANCVVFQGGVPVFADVTEDTLLLEPREVEEKISPRTRAILAVDYTGHPCDYDALTDIAKRRGLFLVADACHSLGGSYEGRPVGSLADLSTFSFHPVKHITTGEGGMVTTQDPAMARRLRSFRNHGLTLDSHERERMGSWRYEMTELGYNYRLTDLQCALGMSQLKRLSAWIQRRREIADRYRTAFQGTKTLEPLSVRPGVGHAYHLFVIQLDLQALRRTRDEVFTALRNEGIGVNVHYLPVHLHPYYQRRFGTGPGLCPVAEAASERILSLPIFPRMSDEEVQRVIGAVKRVLDS